MQGLQNLGSTCAINSLIQIICRTDELRNTILNQNMPDDTLSYQLKEILNMMHNENHSLAPRKFVTHLYKSFDGIFQPGEQLDIGELWMFLFDKIATECGQPIMTSPENPIDLTKDLKEPIDYINSNLAKSDYMSVKCHDVINKINNYKTSSWLSSSQGVMLSLIECHECHEILHNFEPFTSIPLDITDEESPTLASMFRNYLKTQQCFGEWRCEKCNKHTNYTKSLKIWKMPPVLMFIIKRFINIQQKNTKPIKINSKLCIKRGSIISDIESEYSYKCSSLALHYGIMSGGHYCALCQSGDNFVLYDDLNMSIIQPEAMSKSLENNSQAYMIVYTLSK